MTGELTSISSWMVVLVEISIVSFESNLIG